MKTIYKLMMISFATLLLSCETDPILAPDNYVTFKETYKSVSLDVESSVSDEFKVYAGSNSSERSYNLIVDESSTLPSGSYDLPSSVTIPDGTTEGVVEFTVNYTDEFPVTGGVLVLQLEDDANNQLGNSEMTLEVNVTCDNPATVDFVFDGYASEVSWFITDTEENILYSGSGYSNGLETFSRDVCLVNGDYLFIVEDSFGDGLSFPEDGTASIIYNGEVLVQGVGNYGAQFVGEFTIGN